MFAKITSSALLVCLSLGFAGCGRPTETAASASGPSQGSYSMRTIGAPAHGKPWITHLIVADLEGTGRPGIVACEGQLGQIIYLSRDAQGEWKERLLASGLPAPVHLDAVDMDGNGRLDLLVACMGVIMPSNDRIGSVVILHNRGDGAFEKSVVLENVARVTDVRGADLNGNGRMDLVVGQFGYIEGEVRWMENLGDGTWRSHSLLQLAGTIHTPVFDANGDGHPDFAALVSQDWEEVHLFLNDGRGNFTRRLLWGSTNTDFGLSGMVAADVDGDGHVDLVFTNGDAFDFAYPGPRPWHGVQWLRNDGQGNFTYQRLGDFAGAFGPVVADFDGDGDMDIAVVSAFNHWDKPDAITVMIYKQVSPGRFEARPIARRPTHLLATAAADFNGDGRSELVTGSMHAFPPFENLNRILLWERTH